MSSTWHTRGVRVANIAHKATVTVGRLPMLCAFLCADVDDDDDVPVAWYRHIVSYRVIYAHHVISTFHGRCTMHGNQLFSTSGPGHVCPCRQHYDCTRCLPRGVRTKEGEAGCSCRQCGHRCCCCRYAVVNILRVICIIHASASIMHSTQVDDDTC